MYYASCIISLCLHKSVCIYIYIACKYTCTHLPHMLGQTSRWQQGAFATYAGYIRISARGTVWAYVHVFMLPCWSQQNLCIYVCFNFYVCVLACSPPRTARLNIPHSKSGMLGQQVWQQACFKISGPKLHGFPTETRHFQGRHPQNVPTRCQRLQDLASWLLLLHPKMMFLQEWEFPQKQLPCRELTYPLHKLLGRWFSSYIGGIC